MADLVSPIVDIISRLWTCCARHTRYLCKLQQNFFLLKNAMMELTDVRNDVLRRVFEAEADPNEPKMRTDSVSGWLQSVEKIEGEVEVILEKSGEQLRRARSCLGGCCPPNNCWTNYKVGKSIAKKIPSVKDLKVNGHFEEVTYPLLPPHVQDMNMESIVGMESMFGKVWRLINSTDDQVRIMGIYGQVGVGKTTLLKRINNEFRNIHGFHVVIFVAVSKSINYEVIQKKIGERLGLSLQGDESRRANQIFNILRNKNFVLLLDDMWEIIDLQRIGIPSRPPQDNSSKVIFTTRSQRVCELMEATHKFQVQCLPWDSAWSLFQNTVGDHALGSFPDARELAKVVARECGGLPLALITIGRVMSTKKSLQEWNHAIITLRGDASKFPGMGDKVLPLLKLSYDSLRNDTIKSCFLYCALFPEDYSIEIAKLVELWIAEGFIDRFDNLDEARNRGHNIIGSLKRVCLLESSGEDAVKMHDVIRDLALWIVNDPRSSDESGNNSDNKFLVAVNDPFNKKWKNAERIFWDAGSTTRSSSNEEDNPPTSPNLLTLLVKCGYYKWPRSFFQYMPFLRVLDLSNARSFNDEFPMSICELYELRYLNLSGMIIEELPVELRKLVKLKFLVSYGVRRIPAGLIANLQELQVLDLGCDDDDHGFEGWELEDGPSFSELDGLKQLQEVHGITIKTFVALENFLCHRKLQMVCTGLKFSRSSSSSSSRRVLDLSNFKSLKDLVLYGSTVDGGFSELESLEELVLFSNLETLLLAYFPKLKSILLAAAQPDLLSSHFHSLHSIWIEECDVLKDLTWLVHVPNLKRLSVGGCKGLETIIELGDDGLEGTVGGGGGGLSVFGRLEYLYIQYLPKLKSICRHALAFPSIDTFIVYKCPELKTLPLNSGSNVNNTLKRIEGEEEWWNELQWEDETFKFKFFPYDKKGY